MSGPEGWAQARLASASFVTEADLATLFEMLPEREIRRGSRDVKTAFLVGCYAQGGFRGLRKECTEFPFACQLLTRFVQERLPGHVFSSCGIFSNSATPLHKDERNARWPNAVFRLTSFKGGGLWIEGVGSDIRVCNNNEMSGCVHELGSEPLIFDAHSRYHQTEPWTGHRLVLVTWVVQQLTTFANDDVASAQQLGFVLPPEVPRALQTSEASSKPPIVLELFAGKGALSRALRQLGFEVHSFDHHHCDAQVPMLQLDLASEKGQAWFWDFLSKHRPFAIHMGVPCGTSSKARGRPLRNGAVGPQPLRSKAFPLGLPSLDWLSADGQRVVAANKLYSFAFRVLDFCKTNNIIACIENPANSHLWDILQAFEPQAQGNSVLSGFSEVVFDQCCHGGFRPKKTKLLCTHACFESLKASCPGSHMHKPWGQLIEYGSVRFATRDEAAYPAILAGRYARCLASRALALGFALVPRPSTKDQSLAFLGKQNKRHPPLVSEFASVHWQSAKTFVPQPNLKLLRSSRGGQVLLQASKPESQLDPSKAQVLQPASNPESRLDPSSTPSRGTTSEAVTPCGPQASVSDLNFDDFVQVGVLRSPEDFVESAKKVKHPVDSANPLLDVTLRALEENLTKDPKLISLKRNLAIAKVKQEVARHRDKELQLHNSMHPAVAKVMKGKNILALESLLQSEGYDDMGAMAFLKEGVRLVGTSQCPECFDRKIVPAQLTEGELFETAAERREALLQKFEKVDPREAEALKDATDGEVAHGFLEGPYYDKHEVSAKPGTDQWTIIRRFVLFQRSKQKARPIDNCLESQLNAGYSASIHLRLQDSDYIASMALHVAKAISEGRAHAKAANWKGKCLDLSKAYKQLAVYPQHRPLAVIAVRGADGRDALYLSNSLMFGSTAAVYAFNRISRCIWFLINRLLWIPAGVFYDDFPLLSPAESSDNADAVVSAFLDELGWLHAKTGAKGKPFAEEFDVLGMSLQLSSLGQGKVVLANKQGRIERIIERMQEIAAKCEIRRHEAQVLQGLLQYASGFYSGRALKHASHVLAKISSGLHFGPKDLSDFCLHTVSLLRDESPRILNSSMITDVVHLWTDGAWESGIAGVGVAVHDCFAGMGWIYEGRVPAKVLDKWKTEVGEQLICEIEMFAVLATLLELNTFLSARRVIWWIDNDATRAVIIKGASRSWAMHELARLFSELDSQYPSMWWVCRVPSFSNPGDAPSRGHGCEAMAAVGASKVQKFSMLDELSERLCAFKRASVIRGVGAS